MKKNFPRNMIFVESYVITNTFTWNQFLPNLIMQFPKRPKTPFLGHFLSFLPRRVFKKSGPVSQKPKWAPNTVLGFRKNWWANSKELINRQNQIHRIIWATVKGSINYTPSNTLVETNTSLEHKSIVFSYIL